MKGLEPSTFCMASRRSSQLSYIRGAREYSPAEGLHGTCTGTARGVHIALAHSDSWVLR
jgi:hypothetical protein